MRPLIWVSKSMEKLAATLTEMGHPISADTVRKELVKLGFSRQSNRKADEGSNHPDRNAQFEHINAKVITAQVQQQPVISVDTKKKELIGNFKNGGTDYRPKDDPRRVKPSVRKFLGFCFTSGKEPRRRIAPPALARFKSRVRELTWRTRGASLAQIVKELSGYLIGWRGYFGFCETPSTLRKLDEWTRRRLRAIAWKQWRRGRTRYAELRRRGVGRDLAARSAGSPRGPWRLSNSPALTIALSNAFLFSLGLASLAPNRTA